MEGQLMFSKKLKLVFVTSLALVGSVVGIAAAQGKGDDEGDRAGVKDKWKERKEAMLLKYDFNKNGALDDNEKEAMFAERSAKMFEKLDANGDGVLSKAEFAAGKQARGGRGHHRGHGGHHRGGMKGQ
jgi:EF hand